MSERIPMTPSGYLKVLAEFRHHREVLRPQVVRDIEEAREHGDISENAEFADAKERQAHIEGRVRELEYRLALSEVVDVSQIPPSDMVVFGTTVHLEDVDTEEKLTYRIVGQEEANVREGLISYSSPIARALLGRKREDEVRFETPKGTRSVVIIAVLYR